MITPVVYHPDPVERARYRDAQAERHLLNNADRKAAADPLGAGMDVDFSDASTLAASAKPPRWLVDQYLPDDALIAIYGQPGAGKSLLALGWAACIASGTSWHGIPVDEGPTAIICGEGHSGQQRRLQAWAQSTGCALESCRLYISNAPVWLDHEPSTARTAHKLLAIAEKVGAPPRLVVVDTLARNFGGDDS